VDTVPTALLLCSEVNRETWDSPSTWAIPFRPGGNMARDLDMALKSNRLFNVHTNDNYGAWDDDMIVGSVRMVEYLEMFYVLAKRGYDSWISVDIFPYRENQFEAVRESILHMDTYAKLVEKIGVEKLDVLITAGSVTETMRVIRENVYAV
jgi:hypothetical protein